MATKPKLGEKFRQNTLFDNVDNGIVDTLNKYPSKRNMHVAALREELLVYGYIKKYHQTMPPKDIILLIISWIILVDFFIIKYYYH